MVGKLEKSLYTMTWAQTARYWLARADILPLYVAPRLGDGVQRFTKRLAIERAILLGLAELIVVFF